MKSYIIELLFFTLSKMQKRGGYSLYPRMISLSIETFDGKALEDKVDFGTQLRCL